MSAIKQAFAPVEETVDLLMGDGDMTEAEAWDMVSRYALDGFRSALMYAARAAAEAELLVDPDECTDGCREECL